MRVRRFAMDDEEPVLSLWNRCLVADPVTPELFREKILLENPFEPDWCLVSEAGGEILGFIYSPGAGNVAFVNVIFVDSDHRGMGIGGRLLRGALESHGKAGRKSVLVSGGPRYFFPGVDVEAYGRAIDFFRKNGFTELNRDSVAMGRSLVGYRIPSHVLEAERRLDEGGISVRYLEPRHLLGLRLFLRDNFPAWEGVARETIERHPRELDLIVVAIRGAEVVGYCQCASDGLLEHFGPFGVREDMRGREIGAVMFHKCLQGIHAKGCKNVWFAWGGGRNYSFYARHGMAVTRRFATMKADIGP